MRALMAPKGGESNISICQRKHDVIFYNSHGNEIAGNFSRQTDG
jgi:hypothetical protein